MTKLRLEPCGMWYHALWYKGTNSGGYAAFIIRDKNWAEKKMKGCTVTKAFLKNRFLEKVIQIFTNKSLQKSHHTLRTLN